MVNNIQDLFLKYKNKLNTKKNKEEEIISLLREKYNLNIKENNIKLNLKNNTFKLINLKSSVYFYIKNKLKDEDISLIEEKINLKLIFN